MNLVRLALALVAVTFLAWTVPTRTPIEPVVKPYLQLGTSGSGLSLVWLAPDVDVSWTVEGSTAPPVVRRIRIGAAAYRQCVASLGEGGEYRVLSDGQVVFSARASVPARKGQGYRAALLGDIGAGSPAESAIAHAVQRASPEIVLLTGDVVYPRGTHAEFEKNVVPFYNGESEAGVPMMRRVPFVVAPGNHDVPAKPGRPFDLGKEPDGLAYYYDWVQPLNGPLAASTEPPVRGPEDVQKAFREAAGPRFPRMGSFSFDWGCSHWLVLDSNPYVDWTDEKLRRWVADDLASARGSAWRFVMFHHAAFHSAISHEKDQWMRVLEDVFEKGGVDLVFSGHVHNYQRTFPLRFQVRPQADGRWVAHDGRVDGDLVVDRKYDGGTVTRPEGIIHVVSGAGGAVLSDSRQTAPRHSFTCRFDFDTWSFTELDVQQDALGVRQLDADGKVLDTFSIRRP